MSNRDEQPLDALATAISELHSYNGNEQAAAADEAFDAVADLLAEKSKALEKAERERDEARATIEELSVLLEDYKKRVEQDVKEINRLKGLESVCHCGALISDHTQSDNHVFVAVVERCPNAKRLEQAVALLRRVRPMWDADAPEICDLIDAYLAGQPAPESPKCSHGLPWWLCSMHRNEAEAIASGQPAPVKPVVDDAMVERAGAAHTAAMVAMYAHKPGDPEPIHPMRAALVAALEGRG